MTKKTIGMAAAAVLAAQILLNKIGYRVERIVDGDTFVTTENQMIRLAGINAPELENCDGPEAKKLWKNLSLFRLRPIQQYPGSIIFGR